MTGQYFRSAANDTSARGKCQDGREFASVVMSFIQRAGADPASDSTLSATWRNDCGAGDSLPGRSFGNETRRQRVTD
jgi:hypothetical protein